MGKVGLREPIGKEARGSFTKKNGDRAISTNQKIVKRAGKRKIRTELQSRKNELFAEWKRVQDGEEGQARKASLEEEGERMRE